MLYVIVGLHEEGKKDILGLWLLRSETVREWVRILNDLKARGVREGEHNHNGQLGRDKGRC